ncbi:MAG: sugar phosphate nucleotidyltransferase, partial [Chloroflexi bacterium]|nr:sugar phosphate nucleotidyltransferase [Chloroflexota bacterium]
MSEILTSEFSVQMTSPIHDVIACIDRSARISIALVLDEQGRLINTITDGDVRRGILAGISLNDPVSKLLQIKTQMPHPIPVTAPADTDPGQFFKIMQENSIKQLPLLDKNGRVVDIVILSELLPPAKLPLQAVVMAGGLGTRLRPLTDNIPKTMLSVGGRPLMELTIEKLRDAGIEHVAVSTNYRSANIVEHFGDGKAFGIELNYIREDRPLGTAGALGLVDAPDKTLLVINGDIITHVDLGVMFTYHKEHKAELTVGVRQYGVQVPYGVLECEGPNVRKLQEKPQISFLINAGIYLLEPSVYAYISKGQPLDMTDLIQ